MSRFLIILSIVFLFTSCTTTSPLAMYKKIKPDMLKPDVVELMGSPQANHRTQGQDRWTYIFYEGKKRYVREVHFENGRVIYKGPTLKPKITAQEKDAAVEDLNKTHYQNLDLHRASPSGSMKSNDVYEVDPPAAAEEKK